MEDKMIIKLEQEIERMRSKLNHIIVEEIDKVEILRISQELDILITEYICKTT